MTGVLTILLLAILGTGLITGGVFVLAGGGWAMIAMGIASLAGAYVLRRGLNG